MKTKKIRYYDNWQCPTCQHLMTEDESKHYIRCPTGVHPVQHVPVYSPLEISKECAESEIKQSEALADVIWDYLQQDPEHIDRRCTSHGTKTKLGLFRTIQHILKESSQ